jgi:hypothetical protein
MISIPIKQDNINSQVGFEAINIDENIDHVRTYTSAKLYSPIHLAKLKDWLDAAKREAKIRIAEWKNSPIPIKIHT